jgi:hypothetical protein
MATPKPDDGPNGRLAAKQGSDCNCMAFTQQKATDFTADPCSLYYVRCLVSSGMGGAYVTETINSSVSYAHASGGRAPGPFPPENQNGNKPQLINHWHKPA